MSKISDLAKTFQQNSQQEAKDIEKQAKSDIQELRKAINAELKQSEQKIIADIHAQQLRMSKAVFKPYLWSLAGLLILSASIILGLYLLVWNTKKQITELEQQKTEAQRSLDLINSKTKGVLVEECPVENSKATRLCVAIDPKSPPYYAAGGKDKSREWRYIPQNNKK